MGREVLITGVLCLAVCALSLDICHVGRPLNFAEYRIVDNILDKSETPLCDRNVINGEGEWFKTNANMVTNHTKQNACGTRSGIWLDGSLPAKGDGVVSRRACVPSARYYCEKVYNVSLQNCGDYSVYFLPRPTACPEAYCFGYGQPAPTTTITKPSVQYAVVREMGHRAAYEKLIMKCFFTPLNDDSLLYKVYWYFNDKEQVIMDSVRNTDVQKSYLDEQNGLKLGYDIKCAVKLKYHAAGAPGPLSPMSEPFYAGIKVLGVPILLRNGARAKIDFLLTVPFQCPFINKQDQQPLDCILEITMKTLDSMQCDKMPLMFVCGLSISRLKWNVKHSFTIESRITTIYSLPTSYNEITFGIYHNSLLWRNMSLSTVNVMIENQQTGSWMDNACSIKPTVHVVSFMQIQYQFLFSGTFTMYRNFDSFGNTMEVQIRKATENCNYPNFHCVCGVALRAAGDVFIIDMCPDGSDKTQVHVGSTGYFRSCIDDLMDVRKYNESSFRIYFPSGTYVTVNLLRMFNLNLLDVKIQPSKGDIYESMGLCGTVNSTILRRSDGSAQSYSKSTYIQTLETFTLSWRVGEENDLFKMGFDNITTLPVGQLSSHPCICDPHDIHSNRLYQSAYCTADIVCSRESRKTQGIACRVKRNY